MNEKINLCKILNDCPQGMKFYSPLFGEVIFMSINYDTECSFPIEVLDEGETRKTFMSDGRYDHFNKECLLFPSYDQRDWSKWKCPKPKFDPKTLKAFDRVLARIDGGNAYCWFADFVSTPAIEEYDILPCIMSNKDAEMIIPYNEDTKHLVGTTNEAPEYYRYWED